MTKRIFSTIFFLSLLIPVFGQAPQVAVTTRASQSTNLTITQADKNLTDLQHAVNASDRNFGVKETATTGLTFAYYGGPAWNGTAWTLVGDGTTALTPSATNYIERTPSGTVSSNTTAFSASRFPLYIAVTNTSAITALTDMRSRPDLMLSVFGRTGAVTAATGDYTVAQIIGAMPSANPTATGILTIPGGTAAAPSFIFGDTTTGLYRPGSGQLAMTFAGTGLDTWTASSVSWLQPLATLGASTSTNTALNITGTTSTARRLKLQSAGVDRWELRATSTGETGSNAGSDLAWLSYSDAGTLIDTPITLVRAAGGAWTLSRPAALTNATASTSPTTGAVVVTGGVGIGGNLVLNGYLSLSKGTAVASAATITPTAMIFHVTGTTQIATINLPFTGFTGSLTLIPDAAFTTATTGNIALASTAVLNRALTMTWDGTKWYPSY